MGPFDRGILVIYTLTLTLLLGVAAAFLAGWRSPLLELGGDALLPANREIVWALLFLYALMGLWLFWKGIRVERINKRSIVHEQNLGQVRVALPAVEALAEKVVSSAQDVKEVRARVEAVPQGVSINLQLVVLPDVNIPSLSSDIQQQVKDNIYNVVGITVHEVRVAVDKFHISKTRVE